MTGPSSDGGGLNDLPWATVFDPAANARALGAIQAEGFRAASRIVDRFARLAGPKDETAESHSAPTHNDAPAASSVGPAGPDLEQMTRAWWSMFGQLLLGANRTTTPRRAEFDLETPGHQHGIDLEVTAPGCADTEVWLHNRGTRDFGQIRFRSSDLLAHDGNLIHSHEVNLDPHVVSMPARCSRGIAVEVNVGEHIRPGTYRGSLLVEGYDALWLPVALLVRSPAP